MNITKNRNVEIVGTENTGSSAANTTTTTTPTTPSTASQMPGIITSIGQALGSILGNTKWGNTGGGTTIVQSTIPPWVVPVAVGIGGITLIAILSKK